jgi:hypothetical protein
MGFEMFKRADANKDGKLTLDEVSSLHREHFKRLLAKADKDGDGALGAEELRRAAASARMMRGQAWTVHRGMHAKYWGAWPPVRQASPKPKGAKAAGSPKPTGAQKKAHEAHRRALEAKEAALRQAHAKRLAESKKKAAEARKQAEARARAHKAAKKATRGKE